jgi:hypothetical protein
MNKIQNINRYWVDKDSNVIVRKWDEKEYETINPRTHIFEKYWSYYCPICSFIPTPHYDRAEAEHGAKVHEVHTINKHKCVVEYRDHELICMEFRDEFLEDLGIWVAKQEVF